MSRLTMERYFRSVLIQNLDIVAPTTARSTSKDCVRAQISASLLSARTRSVRDFPRVLPCKSLHIWILLPLLRGSLTTTCASSLPQEIGSSPQHTKRLTRRAALTLTRLTTPTKEAASPRSSTLTVSRAPWKVQIRPPLRPNSCQTRSLPNV